MDVFVDANIESFSLSLTSQFPVVSAQDVKSSIFHSGLSHGTIVDDELWSSLLSKTIWIFYSLHSSGGGAEELEEATDVRLVASLLCVLKDVSEARVRRLQPDDFLSLLRSIPQAPTFYSVPSVEALQVCLGHVANQASLLEKEKREASGEKRETENALRRYHIESYFTSVASITSVDRMEVENSPFDSSIVRLQNETRRLEQFLQVVSASDEANTNDEVDTLLVKLAKKEAEGDLAARYYKVQLKRMLQVVTSRSKDKSLSACSEIVRSNNNKKVNNVMPAGGVLVGSSSTSRAIAKEEQASIELVQKALLDFERELKNIASSEAKILHKSNKQDLASFESSKNKVGAQIDSLVDYHFEELKESCKKSVRAFRPLFKRASQVLSSQSIAARETKFPSSKKKDEGLKRKSIKNKEAPSEIDEVPQAEPLVPWKVAVESAFIHTFEEGQKDVNAKNVFARVSLEMERSEASLIRNILSLSTTTTE